MNRINRAGLVSLISLALVVTACATPSTASLGRGSGGRLVAHRPAADAVPTTTGPAPTAPTTALPNLPTVPTVAPAPTTPTTSTTSTTSAPPAYIALQDETGMLTVEVPDTWVDFDITPFVNDDGTLRPGISASTDFDAFNDTWSAPGVVYTAYHFQPDPNVLFGEYDYSGTCTDGGIVPYDDQVFVGYQRTFIDCAAAQSQNYVIVANAPGNTVTIVIVIQTVTAEDQAAYQHILETFNIDPNVSMPTETVPPETTVLPSTVPLPTVPSQTVPAPTVPSPTAPTVPSPTAPDLTQPTVAPSPTPPPLPTSPLLTVPVPTAPVPTVPVPTVPVPTVPVPTVPGTAANGVPAGYQLVSDDTGRLSIQVPVNWIDIDGSPKMEEGVEVAALTVAPDVQTFRETFDGPGLLIHVTPFEVDLDAELARRGLVGQCTPGTVNPNPNPDFAGVYQTWSDCAGTTADLHVLVANPLDGRETTIVVVAQTLTPADEEALKVAFSSYALNTLV